VIEQQRPCSADTYGRELHDTLQRDVDELVEFVRAGLRTASEAEGPRLRPLLREVVVLVLDGLFDQSENVDRPSWHHLGAGLASHVRTRPALAELFDVGTRRTWSFVLQRTGAMAAPASGATDVLIDIWNRLEAIRGPAVQQLLAGYDERRGRHGEEAAGPHAGLADAILDGSYDEPHGLVLAAKQVGFDLASPPGLLVVMARPGRVADLVDAARAVGTAIKGSIVGSPRGRPHDHVPVLVAGASTTEWTVVLGRAKSLAERHGVTILAAGPVEPLDGNGAFGRRYRVLVDRAPVAVAVTSSPLLLTAADVDYHFLLTRASVEERADFVWSTLGPVLATPKAKELLDLLDALYETREAYSGAARLLGVHRNTVDARRKKLTGSTGLSLDVPADAHRLFTASRWVKLLDPDTLGRPRQ
jgi:hypothetical protein